MSTLQHARQRRGGSASTRGARRLRLARLVPLASVASPAMMVVAAVAAAPTTFRMTMMAARARLRP